MAWPRVDAAQQDTAAVNRYVVRSVGDWVAFEKDTARQSGSVSRVAKDILRPLGPLSLVAPDTRVGLRSTKSIDTAYTLVLRDPRSLRTAQWSCKPVAQCLAQRPASQLTLVGPALAASPRTSGLFVHLADDAEARARVRLVGARGVQDDLGLTVLTSDSSTIATDSIVARLTGDREGLVLRICSITGDAGGDCDGTDARGLRADDCQLDSSAHCHVARDGRPTAVTVAVYRRNGQRLTGPPLATGVAIVTPRDTRAAIAAATADYWRDLLAIRASVTRDEFRALTLAAALEIARSSPSKR